jgi:plasmid maintenance system killer protein
MTSPTARVIHPHINDRWRICFQWKNGDALNVEIVDYH